MSLYSSTSLKRSRLKRKPAKRKPGDVDKAYVAWIKTLPCSVPDCLRNDSVWDVIEAHHAGIHGYAQRPSDRTCIPLCVYHHRIGPDAIHGQIGKNFWTYHGIDPDELVGELNERYDSEH